MKKRTGILILILLISALAFPLKAAASGFEDDKVIFGDNYILREGETINGDLVAFGGNITIEKEAVVTGDVAVLGGNLDTNGTIRGNMVTMGGFVALGEEAVINGDMTVLGGSVEQAEGARVEGNMVTESHLPFDFTLPVGASFLEGNMPSLPVMSAPLVTASWLFFRLLIWTGLAVVFVLFIEEQADVIIQTAFHEPVVSTLTGFGVMLIGPIVLLALLITIILSPISLIGIFVLIAAWVVGWISLGLEVGRRLGKAFNQSWAPPVNAGVGIFITLLMFNGFRQIVPCVGFLPKLVAGLWMIGAVTLTRFGTNRYPDPGADLPKTLAAGQKAETASEVEPEGEEEE